MKKIVLTLAACIALAGCSGAGADKQSHETPPAASLLTTKDINDCEKSLGIAPVKTASEAYVLSADSIDKARACAFDREKKRMPLLADLIDKYDLMLRQGNQECAKDIGTHYGDVCTRNSQSDAAEWYNLAVAQRLRSEMPNQPQLQPKKQNQN